MMANLSHKKRLAVAILVVISLLVVSFLVLQSFTTIESSWDFKYALSKLQVEAIPDTNYAKSPKVSGYKFNDEVAIFQPISKAVEIYNSSSTLLLTTKPITIGSDEVVTGFGYLRASKQFIFLVVNHVNFSLALGGEKGVEADEILRILVLTDSQEEEQLALPDPSNLLLGEGLSFAHMKVLSEDRFQIGGTIYQLTTDKQVMLVGESKSFGISRNHDELKQNVTFADDQGKVVSIVAGTGEFSDNCVPVLITYREVGCYRRYTSTKLNEASLDYFGVWYLSVAGKIRNFKDNIIDLSPVAGGIYYIRILQQSQEVEIGRTL